MGKNCIYFVEGSCEKQLVEALKLPPAKLIPGKVIVFNPIQKRLPMSQLLTIRPNSIVVFVYDTDVQEVDILRDNILLIRKFCERVRLVHLMQVPNIEGELVRCTDVKSVLLLTKSRAANDFKSDFCRPTPQACRYLLERHHLNADLLWTAAAPQPFNNLERNRTTVKA